MKILFFHFFRTCAKESDKKGLRELKRYHIFPSHIDFYPIDEV